MPPRPYSLLHGLRPESSPADDVPSDNDAEPPRAPTHGGQRHRGPRPPSEPSPPPLSTTSFSFMAGNFDFPHASSPPPRRPSVESFQQLLRRRYPEPQHVYPADETSDGAEGSALPHPPRRPRMDSNRQRAMRRALPGDRRPRDTRSPARPSTSSNSASRSQLRAQPSEQYLRGHNMRLRSQPSDDVDTLLDLLVPDSFSPNAHVRRRSPSSERVDYQRQTKRRKLGHTASPYDGFKYGYKGQVVQGRLKMEIASCDGGEYDKTGTIGKHPVHNVLKNDKSVYCSRRSRCNLLLKHIGGMPFTLDKVVIRAPDRGFTAPVQEGLVFVSMSSDDLISRTSNYHIDYASPSPRRSPTPDSEGDQQISLTEAVSDAWIWNNSRHAHDIPEEMEHGVERMQLHNRRPRSSSSTRPRRLNRPSDARNEATSPEVCEDDTDLATYALAAGILAPTPPPYSISTSSENESSSSEEQPDPAVIADRRERDSRWHESDEEEGRLSAFSSLRRAIPLNRMSDNERSQWRASRLSGILRASRLRTPSRIEVQDNPGRTGEKEDSITPNARFFIEKHKSKITIRFHPAISGKYVLLKLWSPTHDGNIDIESVQFYGYSGPRYFPAIQPA